MKHFLFHAIFIFLLSSITTQAKLSTPITKLPAPTKYIPKLDFGVKFGGNFDNINGTGWNNTYQTGYHSGVFLGFREHVFGVQGEALLSSGQYTYIPNTDVNNLYLHLPALLEIRVVPGIWLQSGPQYSFLLASKFAGNNNATNYFKQGGLSGVAGLQILLPLHLIIGARYIFGLSDWNEASNSSNTWKIHSVQLFAGFKFL